MHEPPDWVVETHDLDLGMFLPRVHAATLCETPGGLAIAFFGGPYDATVDQGIWFARRRSGTWERPRRVATAPEGRGTCWNPVLARGGDGSLLLFYKVGPRVAAWRGMLVRSYDEGETWDRALPLPAGILGPVRTSPITLSDGALLCPSSTEDGPSWRAHFERTPDAGATWSRTPSVAEEERFDAIQPTILPWPSGRWQALCRSRVGSLVETFSEDEGASWSALRRTAVPNPNAAVDARLLDDGRALLVHNPTDPGQYIHDHREALAAAVSEDEGRTWRQVALLERGARDESEFSYPSLVRSRDGMLHLAYTVGTGWRGIRHLVIDPERIG